jgi:hypothetical protein
MIRRPSINWVADMLILILERRLLWAGPEGSWWYDDAFAWVTGFLVLTWLAWLFVRRYLQVRALRRRPPRRINYRLLKRTAKIKRELSAQYLRPGFSASIHAVGIGMLASGNYCIQVFINDARLWASSGVTLPSTYRGVPLLVIEMPTAVSLSEEGVASPASCDKYPKGIREYQEVIIGGISGANTNLANESGTIGYFCTRRSKIPCRKEIHMLSNWHVFGNPPRAKVEQSDLIMQPSPGEPGTNRPVGTLVDFLPLKFDGDIDEPNHVDAAVAKLWAPFKHKPVIPLIGAVKGYVERKDVQIGEAACKFGRTTGYTEGHVFSICLDIWIRYARAGQSAFFQDQFLIEPDLPRFTKFVSGGDSGSLVVDEQQHAIGLIFAGMDELPESLLTSRAIETSADVEKLKRVEGYGVANPISEVLDRLKIDLVI